MTLTSELRELLVQQSLDVLELVKKHEQSTVPPVRPPRPPVLEEEVLLDGFTNAEELAAYLKKSNPDR